MSEVETMMRTGIHEFEEMDGELLIYVFRGLWDNFCDCKIKDEKFGVLSFNTVSNLVVIHSDGWVGNIWPTLSFEYFGGLLSEWAGESIHDNSIPKITRVSFSTELADENGKIALGYSDVVMYGVMEQFQGELRKGIQVEVTGHSEWLDKVQSYKVTFYAGDNIEYPRMPEINISLEDVYNKQMESRVDVEKAYNSLVGALDKLTSKMFRPESLGCHSAFNVQPRFYRTSAPTTVCSEPEDLEEIKYSIYGQFDKNYHRVEFEVIQNPIYVKNCDCTHSILFVCYKEGFNCTIRCGSPNATYEYKGVPVMENGFGKFTFTAGYGNLSPIDDFSIVMRDNDSADNKSGLLGIADMM